MHALQSIINSVEDLTSFVKMPRVFMKLHLTALTVRNIRWLVTGSPSIQEAKTRRLYPVVALLLAALQSYSMLGGSMSCSGVLKWNCVLRQFINSNSTISWKWWHSFVVPLGWLAWHNPLTQVKRVHPGYLTLVIWFAVNAGTPSYIVLCLTHAVPQRCLQFQISVEWPFPAFKLSYYWYGWTLDRNYTLDFFLHIMHDITENNIRLQRIFILTLSLEEKTCAIIGICMYLRAWWTPFGYHIISYCIWFIKCHPCGLEIEQCIARYIKYAIFSVFD